MKKVNLTESDLVRLIGRVLREQSNGPVQPTPVPQENRMSMCGTKGIEIMKLAIKKGGIRSINFIDGGRAVNVHMPEALQGGCTLSLNDFMNVSWNS